MTITERPEAVTVESRTKDDGLFGPDSITWRCHTDPTMLSIGGAAATTQMLHPKVMRMIDQASSFRRFPERRAQRTGEYIMTITYGDRETAEHAGATLRKIHQHATAVDPESGETYHAEVDDLLLWVHNSLTWSSLRAWDAYGPELTPAEQDQYITEQRIAAGLIAVPLDRVASTRAELDAYMDGMLPHLAVTHEAVWFRDMMVPTGFPLGVKPTISRIVNRAAIGLMAPEHREMFGIKWPEWQDRADHLAAAALFGAIRKKVPVAERVAGVREGLDATAFGARHPHPAPAT
jgi:uncharacterized protein (DUF2236 family)